MMPHVEGDTVYWAPFTTPLGTAYAASTSKGLCRLSIPEDSREHFFVGLQRFFNADHIKPNPEPNIEIIRQLDRYWRGELTRFEIRLDLHGTDFQIAVWESLLPPSGALVLAWESRRVPRPELTDLIQSISDLVVLSEPPYGQMAHRVDRVIKQRDVIVARPRAGLAKEA